MAFIVPIGIGNLPGTAGQALRLLLVREPKFASIKVISSGNDVTILPINKDG